MFLWLEYWLNVFQPMMSFRRSLYSIRQSGTQKHCAVKRAMLDISVSWTALACTRCTLLYFHGYDPYVGHLPISYLWHQIPPPMLNDTFSKSVHDLDAKNEFLYHGKKWRHWPSWEVMFPTLVSRWNQIQQDPYPRDVLKWSLHWNKNELEGTISVDFWGLSACSCSR